MRGAQAAGGPAFPLGESIPGTRVSVQSGHGRQPYDVRPMTPNAAVPSTRRPFPAALVALPIAGVALGQRFVLPGASIADLTLAAAITLGLAHLAREARTAGWPPLPRWTRWLAALWAWAALGGAVHLLSGSEP